MTGMFREWVTGQNQGRNVGQDPGPSQNREVEERQNEDQPPVGEKTKAPLDIMKEVHKSKLPYFSGKEEGQVVEAWLVGIKRALSFRDYISNEKTQISMSLLKGDALLWWVNEERKLHIASLQVTWELFEETFRTWYLSDEFKHQQIATFHAVHQKGRPIENYKKHFFSLVHNIDYMADDGRHVERFLHGLDEEVINEVAMWKPTTITETSNLARQVQRRIYMKKQRTVGATQIRGRSFGNRDRHYGTSRMASVSTIPASSRPPSQQQFQRGGGQDKGHGGRGLGVVTEQNQIKCFVCQGPHLK